MANRPRVLVDDLPSAIPQVPVFKGEDELDVAREAVIFLDKFKSAVEQGNWDAFSQLFDGESSFWRDSLTLTFDKRTFHGDQSITGAWKDLSSTRRPSNFSLSKDDTWDMTAQFVRLAPTMASLDVPFGFSVDAPDSKCIGVAKLIPRDGKWKIWVLSTAIDALEEHPFTRLPRCTPSMIKYSQRGRVEAQGLPQVKGVLDAVVIGANASGLANTIMLDSLGANVAAFDVEQIVGSTWAKSRYDDLTLHHPAYMIQLPRFPVPKKYPKYMTGHDLMDYYGEAIEELKLPVFGGIKVLSNSFSEADNMWRVHIQDVKTHQDIVVEASNIVMCNGFLVSPENPYIPPVTDGHLFKGPVQHTVHYRTPAPYKDRDVIVVGSGNSAHDVAQNLALNGTKSVTILQRSPTVLVDFDKLGAMMAQRYQGNIPVEVADFLDSGMPVGILRDMTRGMIAHIIESEIERNAQLESKGYMLDRHPCVIARALEERGRSFYLDQPKTFDLVMNDQIKIARGEAKRFVEDGLVVYDKTENKEKVLKADGIVYGTGYEWVDLPKKYADSGFIDAKSASMLVNVGLFGVDAEGETPGYITSSGHPHLYFSGIGFINARFIARYTAIQVMADVTGKFPKRYPRSF